MSVLVGKKAPDFDVAAVLGNGEIVDSFSLSSAIKGKYGLVFFYPLDFTFVCPSELIALDRRIPEFQERNVEVIGVSIDSHFTHNAWRNTPVDQGGIGPVRYTLHDRLAGRRGQVPDRVRRQPVRLRRRTKKPARCRFFCGWACCRSQGGA